MKFKTDWEYSNLQNTPREGEKERYDIPPQKYEEKESPKRRNTRKKNIKNSC